MVQKLSTVAAWLALGFIASVTLSPIEARPVVAGLQFEHFVAFALMGLAFGLAFPERMFFAVAIVVGSALLLEAMQLLTPDRHGRVLDALVKQREASVGSALVGFGTLSCGRDDLHLI